MPRVHYVKKAQKDNSAVKKGEPYYHWQHAFRPVQRSKTHPKPSQLTLSEFMGEYLSMGEDFEEGLNGVDTTDGLVDARQELMDRIEQLVEETQGKLDNMPDGLQEAETGQLMQERIDGLEGWRDELEGVDLEDWDPDNMTPDMDKDEAHGEWITEKCGELTSVDPGIY